MKLLFIAAAVFSPLLPVSLYFSGNWYSVFHSYSLGIIFGIFSYVYFLNTLIISSRIRILDRLFGHDKVMKFHGMYALAALILGALHIYFKNLYGISYDLQVKTGIAAYFIFSAVCLAAILVMVSGAVHRISFFGKLKNRLSKTWLGDYSRLKLFHNSVSIAALLAAVHVNLASSTRESSLRIEVMRLWAITAALFYLYHKFFKPLMLYFKRWSVSNVKEVGPGIIEITFMRKAHKTFGNHKPGQYAYLRLLSPVGGYEEHPFTISSAPCEDELKMVIKKAGDYTEKLSALPLNTAALIDGPYGVFTPSADKDPLLFIAGGIGITPFLSILKSMEPKGPEKPLILLWSTRTAKEMFCRHELETLARKNTFFTFIPIYTREKNPGGYEGRISSELISEIVSKNDFKDASAFICGPDAFKENCRVGLLKSGLGKGKIHYESFS
jgi:predicted ferric reductase